MIFKIFHKKIKFFIFSTIFVFIYGSNLENYKVSKGALVNSIELISNKIIVKIIEDIKIEDYFNYLDSIVQKYDSIVPYKLTEHLLVHANSWIIDSLANTDYYRMMEKDSFVFDQRKLIILKKGQELIIPDKKGANELIQLLNKTLIDVNIPEYKLRIYQDSLLYTFPIRVGRNEKKYLKMGDRITNLKTRIGDGQIVAHVKNPEYYNPVNGQQFYITKRDDEKITKMPQIPWIETEINGMYYGQLIHPTTNPKTLGKAYSNGCIGTKEADAWIIYYFAPIGTKISIRYNLQILDKNGDSIALKDIYK